MIAYAVEPWADLNRDATAAGLFEAHWAEVGGHPDQALCLQVERYAEAEDAQRLACFTVRDDGQLVGYAVVTQADDRLRGGLPVAWVEFVYISPKWRRGFTGVRFLAFIDDVLRGLGVPEVIHQVTPQRPFGPVLERMGYRPVSTLYSRRL